MFPLIQAIAKHLCFPQKEYITVLSKRMKKLEAQFTGQQPPPPSQNSSFAPVTQQPQQYQQPQAAMAQRQHQLFLQQQQLQLQQQQQQQLAAQQQQHMHIQKSQLQQQQQQAQSRHLPQQSTGISTRSHEEDFANMADMFGLCNGAASATANSHQQQTCLHAQRLQQQQAMMPQIPRQGLNAEQLKQQQQLFQQQQQRQQQQMRQAQQAQARQQQQLQQQQQLRHQQQQQQQAQQLASAYPQQSQSAASWQPVASSTQLQASQQMVPDTQAQSEKDNQARVAQFWEIQGQLRKRYLPQLQALKDNPFMRSQHISQPTRVCSPVCDLLLRDWVFSTCMCVMHAALVLYVLSMSTCVLCFCYSTLAMLLSLVKSMLLLSSKLAACLEMAVIFESLTCNDGILQLCNTDCACRTTWQKQIMLPHCGKMIQYPSTLHH